MFVILRFLLRPFWWPLVALLGLSYLGQVHPIGDSFAVFRPQILMALSGVSLILLLARAWLLGLSGLAIVALALVEFSQNPATAQADQINDQQRVTVYQKNLLFLLTDTSLIEADIRKSNADIVTLQEVNPRNEALIADLSDLYPSQHICPFQAIGSVAVLSKWGRDGDAMPCNPENGLAAMRVDTGRMKLWVAALHLRWPWPYAQAGQVLGVSDAIAPLEAPLVLAGDFNMVPWGHSISRIELAGSIELTGWAGPTLSFRELPISLGLDHVMMPKGARAITTETRPKYGSDHDGVLAEFALP